MRESSPVHLPHVQSLYITLVTSVTSLSHALLHPYYTPDNQSSPSSRVFLKTFLLRIRCSGVQRNNTQALKFLPLRHPP